MAVQGARERISRAALSWGGVTQYPHRFGGTEYRLGRREIGHVHDDHLVDIAFPKLVRDEIVEAGLAKAHHLLPKSGWVSFYIESADVVDQAVALLRRSYELAVAHGSGNEEA
jgi:hypothetical protein